MLIYEVIMWGFTMIKYCKKNKSLFGIFFACAFLPGCMKVPVYHQQPLQLVGNYFSYYGDNDNVIVRAKLLNAAERHAMFGRHMQELHDEHNKSLQMIYVSIHNLSDLDYTLCSDDIQLKHIPYGKLNKLMKKTNSIGRLAVAGVGGGLYAEGYVMWQALCQPGVGDEGFFILPIMCVCVIGGTIALVIGGAQGIKSMIMNRRISKDLREKTLSEKVVINSGDHYEGLIFVRSADYTSQFTVTLHEKDNKKNILTFDVDLNQNKE